MATQYTFTVNPFLFLMLDDFVNPVFSDEFLVFNKAHVISFLVPLIQALNPCTGEFAALIAEPVFVDLPRRT